MVQEDIRLLLIEDNPGDRALLFDILEEDDGVAFAIDCASHLKDGIDLLDQQPVDVVLLDLGLPDCNGMQTLDKLVAHNANVPLVVLTGLESDEKALEAMRHGAQDYIPKTNLTSSLLVRSIRYAIERKKAEQALEASRVSFTSLAEKNADGILVVNEEGIIVYANSAASALFDQSIEELNENSVDLPMEERETIEIDVATLGGKPAMAEMRCAPVDWNGTPARVAMLRDITKRKSMETQLLHAQKLESIGQLAAGIAHEINTPSQFVADSVHFIKSAFDDIWELLESYREVAVALKQSDAFKDLLDKVESAEEDADLEYLEEHLPGAFERTFEGFSRIASIVNAMKEFAHPDQKEKCPADINHALKNTLTISRNEYKYVCNVETDLGQLPTVYCHIGDLNQVFLNLIVNAAHAIGNVVKDSGQKGTITIQTRRQDDRVIISIGDNGSGIPEEIRDRIFDPFFTTKGVGKGSGQGLAISRSMVVDKHGGSLTCASTVGEGTTFTIDLPINDNNETTVESFQ